MHLRALFSFVQMADAPEIAEAQPLPPALQIGQSLYVTVRVTVYCVTGPVRAPGL